MYILLLPRDRETLAHLSYFSVDLLEGVFVVSMLYRAVDVIGDLYHLGFFHATSRERWSTKADTRRVKWFSRVVGDGVFVGGDTSATKCFLGDFAGDVLARHVEEEEVRLSATSHEVKAAAHEFVRECLGILYDLLGVDFELWLASFFERHGDGGCLVVVWAALDPWDDGAVDEGWDIFFGDWGCFEWGRWVAIGQDERATWAAEGLVGRGRHDVCDTDRIWVDATGDEASHVRHVGHEKGANFVGNLFELVPFVDLWVGTTPGDDELGFAFFGERAHLIKVNKAVFLAAVLHGVVKSAGEVELEAVGHVTAVKEFEAHERVTRLEESVHDGHVGWAARVRLHIGPVSTKECLGAVAGEVLNIVNIFAAAVVAHAWVAFGIFVGEARAGCFEHGFAGMVFRGNHLEAVILAGDFFSYERSDVGVL